MNESIPMLQAPVNLPMSSLKRLMTTTLNFEGGDIFVKHTHAYALLTLALGGGMGLVSLNQYATSVQLEKVPTKAEITEIIDTKLQAMEARSTAHLQAMEARNDAKLQAMEARILAKQ